MTKPFASYEKNIITNIVKIKHTVRIRRNARKIDVLSALEEIPNDAVVVSVVDNDNLGKYGEIVFEETVEE